MFNFMRDKPATVSQGIIFDMNGITKEYWINGDKNLKTITEYN